MQPEITQEFLKRFGHLVDFCVPQFDKEGKSYLTIAIGCTGGRHRSVVLTNWLTERLRDAGYRVTSTHRDLNRSAVEGAAKKESQKKRKYD
jgi:UPF0042 nucleotide-binding protein